jgi:hypothetical protein
VSIYTKKAKSIEDAFVRSVEGLAADFRREVLVPLCKKHELRFLSGNGDYFFILKSGETIADPLDDDFKRLPKSLQRPLLQAFEVLNYEVGRDNRIGFYVMNVDGDGS